MTNEREALIDPEDGENRAVRSFLLGYLMNRDIVDMKQHMRCSGFPYWPEWVTTGVGHLSKSGAQDWLRHLFGLESAALAHQAPAVPKGWAQVPVIATDPMIDAFENAMEGAGTYVRGFGDAYRAMLAAAPKPTPCAGMSCGTTTAQHSPECVAEHAAAVAGGRFVKAPEHMALVPREPTDAMEVAAENHYEESGTPFPNWRSAWRQMVAAALQGDGNG